MIFALVDQTTKFHVKATNKLDFVLIVTSCVTNHVVVVDMHEILFIHGPAQSHYWLTGSRRILDWLLVLQLSVHSPRDPSVAAPGSSDCLELLSMNARCERK